MKTSYKVIAQVDNAKHHGAGTVLLHYRAQHDVSGDVVPHQGERAKARRRKQLLAGRLRRGELHGDYLEAVAEARSWETPKVIILGNPKTDSPETKSLLSRLADMVTRKAA